MDRDAGQPPRPAPAPAMVAMPPGSPQKPLADTLLRHPSARQQLSEWVTLSNTAPLLAEGLASTQAGCAAGVGPPPQAHQPGSCRAAPRAGPQSTYSCPSLPTRFYCRSVRSPWGRITARWEQEGEHRAAVGGVGCCTGLPCAGEGYGTSPHHCPLSPFATSKGTSFPHKEIVIIKKSLF